jgi:hypothetical protein
MTGMVMKRVKLVIHEPLINRIIGNELNLFLPDKANLVDVINEADKLINNKGGFPLPDYQSLLHMVYNPIKNRFYKQAAVTAYNERNQMLNVRDDPKQELPEDATIILIPTGGCISEWEQALNYKEFMKAVSKQNE